MAVDTAKLDIEFLLDKSGSMLTADCPGGRTRWQSAEEVGVGLAVYASKFDADGIAVVPFARSFKVYEGQTADKVRQVFKEVEPGGGTDTAAVLKNRLVAYFDRKAKGDAKSVLLFVLTDGEPDDRNAVADVIVAATKRMDRDEEVAIQFVQIGKDPKAAEFLKFLDDGLTARGAKFDIVDTVTLAEVEALDFAGLVEKSFAD